MEKTDPKVTEPRLLAGVQTASIRVIEAFKGVEKDQVFQLRDQFSSCFGGFREGAIALFYLYRGNDSSTWRVPYCYRPMNIEGAADDLSFLRGLPDSARGNRVSGTVELWEDSLNTSSYKTRAVGGVSVRLSGEAGAYVGVTDTNGLYEFRNLRPGTYTLSIDYPKGTKLRFSMPYGRRDLRSSAKLRDQLDVTEDSGNGIDFTLRPDTEVKGHVYGPDGEPLKDVCLNLEGAREGDPANRWRFAACTKADGSYRVEGMPAGFTGLLPIAMDGSLPQSRLVDCITRAR